MTVTLDQIYTAVQGIRAEVAAARRDLGLLAKRMDILMTQQDDINASTQAIQQAVTDLGQATANIQAEIEALKNAHPDLDLAGLDAAVAALRPAVDAVEAIAAPPGG